VTKTKKSKLRDKATRTVRYAALLQLMRRSLRDAVTFCAFEIIREPTRTEKRRLKERFAGGNGLYMRKLDRKLRKKYYFVNFI
jgi:hypothetical protein